MDKHDIRTAQLIASAIAESVLPVIQAPPQRRMDYAMVSAEYRSGEHRGCYLLDLDALTATPRRARQSTPAGVLAHPIPAVRDGDELVLNADQVIDPITGKWIVRPAGRRVRIVQAVSQ